MPVDLNLNNSNLNSGVRSAFSTKNRRIRFLNKKLTCLLFEQKIDVFAFSTKNLCVLFFHKAGEMILFYKSKLFFVIWISILI